MKLISEGLGAEAAALSRVLREDTGSSKSILFDRPGLRSAQSPLERSYGGALLGEFLTSAKIGSIWFKTQVDAEIDVALAEFHRRRNLREMVVIPLEAQDRTVDVLELHFEHDMTPSQVDIVTMLAATLTGTWKNRSLGLMAGAVVLHRARAAHATLDAPILSHQNPAGLSRAEYRVCVLMSRGLSVKSVRRELSISPSTLRTHLRHIYLKTSLSGQTELAHHLLTKRPVVSIDAQLRSA
ncbi:helix-turn-helix transcriptional regulator [Sulfitobacter sabulilitoris]|uniref:helix-turn-helix transcriptional regulator n=1 Tax=Sulfitobacter sabulilitoris TaxID=2562655 RepID=UPI001479489C|nr:helix-turn-helix transcriptional regulator [Sulfitobacter sabulilitoris]